MSTLAPAATARLKVASTFSRYRKRPHGFLVPGVGALDMPGNSSANITWESPICISAWPILPSGPAIRIISLAPKADLEKSIAWAESLQGRYVVIVGDPSGSARTAFCIVDCYIGVTWAPRKV